MADAPDPKKRLPGESFPEWRERLRAAKEPPAPAPKPASTDWDGNAWDPSLVPDAVDDSERSEDDIEIDRALESIDILDAYRVWCGKMTPDARGKTESIMISCPIPGHADRKPSAYINTDKQVWHCAACDEGGDKYDIAAFRYGMEGYKTNPAMFMDLRKKMAGDFGWTIKKVAGGQIIIPPDPTPDPTPPSLTSVPAEDADDEKGESPAPDPVIEQPTPSNVAQMHAVPDDADSEEEQMLYPQLNWRAIIPEDTFLHDYLEATCNDDSPEEYHVFHGLLALGHAVGRNVVLEDTQLVYSNMLVCLLGGTGFGKSRSRRWLTEVLEEVLPFNMMNTPPTGVKQIVPSGSGEHLIQSFVFEAKDPATGANLGGQPVNGIVDFDEMDRIMRTINRQNSILGPVIMQMGDAAPRVAAGSLTGGERVAVKPFCSIATSTQPRSIRSMFSQADSASGFLNRWLFVAGPPKKREAMGGRHSKIRVDLGLAKDRLKHVRGWGAATRECYLSNEAFEVWQEYHDKNVEPLIMNDESGLLKRLDLTLKKIILLMAINKRETEITAETVNTALMFTEYFLQCSALLADNVGVTRNKEIADEIMRHARRHQDKTGRGVSTRDLAMYMKRKNYSPDDIKRSIETLIALDWLELTKSTGVGRPTVRYKVVGL